MTAVVAAMDNTPSAGAVLASAAAVAQLFDATLGLSTSGPMGARSPPGMRAGPVSRWRSWTVASSSRSSP